MRIAEKRCRINGAELTQLQFLIHLFYRVENLLFLLYIARKEVNEQRKTVCSFV